MNVIRLIKNDTELAEAQAEMGRLLEISHLGHERTAEQEERLDVLCVVIRAYEDEHWALPMPDPIFAIQHRMEELGLQQSDMLDEFGNKTTASQIMNRKRSLSLPVIRRLAARLGLPIAV
jgi:HTH-type transcriptional regulator/antitoxin HigA